jgi:hypothetical protein
MHTILKSLGKIGEILEMPLPIGILVFAAAKGAWNVTNKAWVAWLAAVIVFVMLALILWPLLLAWPPLEALQSTSCHGLSYQACLDRELGDD